jgi:hypothetical protein
MLTLVAPEVIQLSVVSSPAVTLSALAVNELIEGTPVPS